MATEAGARGTCTTARAAVLHRSCVAREAWLAGWLEVGTGASERVSERVKVLAANAELSILQYIPGVQYPPSSVIARIASIQIAVLLDGTGTEDIPNYKHCKAEERGPL